MPSVKIFRWRFRGARLDERELRAAAGDMLDQLRPRRVLRDALDFALKFQNDGVFRDYVLSRIWAVLPVVLVFFLVSTICSIDIMFRTVRLVSDPPLWLRFFALLLGGAALRVPDLARGKGGAKGPLGAREAHPRPRRVSRLPQIQPRPASLDSRPGLRRLSPGDHGARRALGRAHTRHAGGARPSSVQEVRFLKGVLSTSLPLARSAREGSPDGNPIDAAPWNAGDEELRRAARLRAL